MPAPIARPLFSSSFSSSSNSNDNTFNSSTNMTTTNMESLRVKRLSDKATIPTRGSPLSAGFDLSSAEEKTIAPGARAVVKTDLSIACPEGTYGRIAPRSGLTVKNGIHVGAGVVDADYRGPVGVVLFNFGEVEFSIKVGDRIAQLILEEVKMVPVVDVGDGDLDVTERGAGGFGSTGVSKTVDKEPVEKKARTVSPNLTLPDPPAGNSTSTEAN